MLQQSLTSHPRCECHECTQARWKMSYQNQIQGAIGQMQGGLGQTAQTVRSYDQIQGIARQQQSTTNR